MACPCNQKKIEDLEKEIEKLEEEIKSCETNIENTETTKKNHISYRGILELCVIPNLENVIINNEPFDKDNSMGECVKMADDTIKKCDEIIKYEEEQIKLKQDSIDEKKNEIKSLENAECDNYKKTGSCGV